MSSTRTRKRPSTRRPAESVGKPRGLLHPRVEQVGPEHFGIVCFDCAKARSKFLLAGVLDWPRLSLLHPIPLRFLEALPGPNP
jgi:hypothetical protein